jgi:glycosyltransferase involved in cell wall biosynthesis
MFNKMYERGLELGIEVEVAFQAQREAQRSWKNEDFDMRFPYYVSTGLGLRHRKPKETFSYGTLNVDIIRDVASGRYDWVMMSSFMSISNWIGSVVPAGITKRLLWSESNVLSSRHQGWLIQKFRRFLGRHYEALVCPGQRAVEYIHRYDQKATKKPVIYLPNIVDASLFIDRVNEFRENRDSARSELGIENDKLIILCVGRLVPIKGFGLLIEAAAEVDGDYQVEILGEGLSRKTWQSRIDELGLTHKVILRGQVAEEGIVRFLASADWLIHPAYSDPSPLVTIEATTAGLPLAISVQTGNSPEVVDEEVNGFTFDPCKPAEMIGCLERIIATGIERRREMGTASARLAKERFDPDMIISKYFRAILDLVG